MYDKKGKKKVFGMFSMVLPNFIHLIREDSHSIKHVKFRSLNYVPNLYKQKYSALLSICSIKGMLFIFLVILWISLNSENEQNL